MPSLLAMTLVVMATMTSGDAGAMGVTFRPGVTLLRLAVDNSTASVYVGAVNHVYELTPDHLEPASVAITGTVLFYAVVRFPIVEAFRR